MPLLKFKTAFLGRAAVISAILIPFTNSSLVFSKGSIPDTSAVFSPVTVTCTDISVEIELLSIPYGNTILPGTVITPPLSADT